MSRTNSQAGIVSEEQLAPRANRLVIKKNNQRFASDSHITDIMMRFFVEILRHHKLYKPVSLTTTIPIIYLHHFWTTINHNKNNHTFTFELDNHTFTLTAGLLKTVLQMPPPDPNNTYIKPPSEIQILEFIKTLGYDEDPETKMIAISKMVAWRAILSVLNRSRDYKFRMEIPDSMINDAIKKDQVVNVPNKLKKDLVPRKTRSLTIVEEIVVDELTNSISIQEPVTQQHRMSQLTIDGQTDEAVADMYNEWGQKLKAPAVKDLAVYSLLDLRKGSKSSRLKSLRSKKKPVAREGSSATHNKYYDSSYNDSEATLYSTSSDTTEESANETDDVDESDMDLSDDNPIRDDDAAGYEVFMHNKSTATPNSTYLGSTVTSSSLDFLQTLLDNTPANDITDFMSHLVYTDAQTTSVVHYPEGNPEITSYISSSSKVPLAFEKGVQAKVLTEIKKRLPTHIPNVLANYVKPLLYTSVLEVIKNNQISLFTQSSTSTNDLSKLDLKIKLLHKIQESKSNTTHPTNQKLYDTLYESVCLDHEALNDLDAKPSFHKWAHDNQDPPNNREGEKKKKHRKDVGEPFSKSSRRNKSPMVHAQDDTPDIQPNENHILRPSAIIIANKLKAIIQKDELAIADIEGAGLERLKRSFERHMSKNTKPHPSFYNNNFYYFVRLSMEEKYTTSITKHCATRYYKQGIEDMISDRWSKETHRYIFEAHNGIDQMIPFTMSKTYKRVVYLNQHNIKSLMKLSEVKKFYDGILLKIRENLVDMVTKNKLGTGKKLLKGKD
uniref:Uncharacterized protein n=1 Tax=Tanacetum cinerariifolium TaxID=118510 RepID=A0A699GZ93_TANCI|nr:hypothetical protein [Tanacetum cinerariifolium]